MGRKFSPLTYDENALDEQAVKSLLGQRLLRIDYDSAQPVLIIDPKHWRECAAILRDAPELAYDYFSDVTAADLSRLDDFEPEQRFQVICILYSTKHRRRIRMKAYLGEENPVIQSLQPVFKGADWTEREVYEMFGITFEGHPNLIRLLTPEYMKDFPLRKEYPMQGKGERDNFPRYEEIK